MKNLIPSFIFIFITTISLSQTNASFFQDANTFFLNNVKNDKVDYNTISLSEKQELYNLTDFLATTPYDKSIEKAYLINAYNLFVISGIVENYPVNSPMDIDGFFENKDFILNEKLISLNELENDILRKTYKDPRLHFVLVCGALGCPPITNFAYTPELLEKQLDNQTKKALNTDSFVHQNDEESTVYLSEIFEWYAVDFGKNKNEILDYINTFRLNQFNTNYKIKYYAYDWTINRSVDPISLTKVPSKIIGDPVGIKIPGGQTFNAGSLLRKKQFDLTLFNTLYTQTKSNWLGEDFTGQRSTFNTHLIQFTYGVGKNSRVNMGFDVNFKSSASSTDSTAKGISNAFLYTNTDSSRVGITSAGLRLKLQPFKSVTNFTIQSSLLVPTIKIPEGDANLFWADWARVTWWNQFFYTNSFGKFQVFTEFDLLFRLKIYDNQISMLDLPMGVFLSYFPTKKITIYGMTQHVPRFTNDIKPQSSNDWVIPSNYTASGLGMKYQINRGLNIELLYTNFWRGTNSGLGSTFNFGIKYISK